VQEVTGKLLILNRADNLEANDLSQTNTASGGFLRLKTRVSAGLSSRQSPLLQLSFSAGEFDMSHQYQAAAPMFETALDRLAADAHLSDKTTIRRVFTDQVGIGYGMSGNLAKARTIFLKGIAKDPGYASYYHNLVCADAGESNFSDAKTHLREAFARKANAIRGETLPDPMHDDSFLPYRGNKEFWTFLEKLSRAPSSLRMRKHAHIDPIRRANKPVQIAAEAPL
jgi:tetratricopeptide (TPR) repeat protein